VNTRPLVAEREHLAKLLEAVQRCAHFLHASAAKVRWPLDGQRLRESRMIAPLTNSDTMNAMTRLTMGGSLHRAGTWSQGVAGP